MNQTWPQYPWSLWIKLWHNVIWYQSPELFLYHACILLIIFYPVSTALNEHLYIYLPQCMKSFSKILFKSKGHGSALVYRLYVICEIELLVGKCLKISPISFLRDGIWYFMIGTWIIFSMRKEVGLVTRWTKRGTHWKATGIAQVSSAIHTETHRMDSDHVPEIF